MKIVIDDKIPYIRDAIKSITREAVYLQGSKISSKDIRDADALIVRTRTCCNEALLMGSNVSFIATATAGYDHIDVNYMERAKIKWMACPGCNSSSVAQYVNSSLLLLKQKRGTFLGMTIGIIGYGHVGKKVAKKAQDLGLRVLISDPPLKEAGIEGEFVEMEEIKKECDIITFHVPLTFSGPHPTVHLANEKFFDTLEKCPIIINTSRGKVVDEVSLINAIRENKVKDVVVDVWENEPKINLELLELSWISTPHIAGYSADGKVNANNMVLEGLCQHFGIKKIPKVIAPLLPHDFTASKDKETLCLQLYNPLRDSFLLKENPEDFERLRNEYPLRRETF